MKNTVDNNFVANGKQSMQWRNGMHNI